MDNLDWLKMFLIEKYPSLKFTIIPVQKVFTDKDKIAYKNILYFGFFSGFIQITANNGEVMDISDSNTRSFLFSKLRINSSVLETFIGYEITFETNLIFDYDLLIEEFGIFSSEFNNTFN